MSCNISNSLGADKTLIVNIHMNALLRSLSIYDRGGGESSIHKPTLHKYVIFE